MLHKYKGVANMVNERELKVNQYFASSEPCGDTNKEKQKQFNKGFACAWELFQQQSRQETNAFDTSNTNESLLVLFESFKKSSYYEDSTQIDVDWLSKRLSADEIEELEGNIWALILENEEEIFINSIHFIWSIIKELKY